MSFEETDKPGGRKPLLHTVSRGFASSLALPKAQKEKVQKIVDDLSTAISKNIRRAGLIANVHFTRLLESEGKPPLSKTVPKAVGKQKTSTEKKAGTKATAKKKWVSESLQWKEDTFWRQLLLLEGKEPSHCDEEVKKTWSIVSEDFANDPVVRASFDGQCLTYAAQSLKTAFFNNLWVPFYSRVRRCYRTVVAADERCASKESAIKVSIAVQNGLQDKEWSPAVAEFVTEVRGWLGIDPDDPVEVSERWLKGHLSAVMRANYEMQKRFAAAGVRQMRLTPIFRVKKGHVRLDAKTIADIMLHVGATKKKTWKRGERSRRRRDEKKRAKAKMKAKKSKAKVEKAAIAKRKGMESIVEGDDDTFLSPDDYDRRRVCLSSFFKIPREGENANGERRRFFWTVTMTTDGVTAHFQCVRSVDWEAFVASQTGKTASKVAGKRAKTEERSRGAGDGDRVGEAVEVVEEDCGDGGTEEKQEEKPPAKGAKKRKEQPPKKLYPENVVTISVDPGRVNIVYVVVRGKDKDGQDIEKTYVLTAGRYYEVSGVRRMMRRIVKWQAHLELPKVLGPVVENESSREHKERRKRKSRRKLTPEELRKKKRGRKRSAKKRPEQTTTSPATRTVSEARGLRTTSVETARSYIRAYNRVSTAWWSEVTKRRYGRQRFHVFTGKRSAVDSFCAHLKKEVVKNHGEEARVVVVYGGAKFSPSGKGNLTVPTTAIFQAFTRTFDDVQIQDEFRTTLCCPTCHTAQHKVWRVEGDPHVHHGPRFSPSKEGQPAKKQVRGSLFCPKCCDLRSRDKKAAENIGNVWRHVHVLGNDLPPPAFRRSTQLSAWRSMRSAS